VCAPDTAKACPPLGATSFGASSRDAARGDPEDAPEPGPIRRVEGAPAWPKDYETGLQAARAFAHHFGLVEEDSLVQRVNRIGYEVASQSGDRNTLFTFHILDVPEPNALALPGGFIFITRGMMHLHLDDAPLAHLLGHEVAHVTERHFARADRLAGALSLLQAAVLVAAVVAVPSSSSGGYDRDPDTGQLRASLAGKDAAIQGSNIFGSVFRELLVRGYGRGLEMEADERGRRFAGRAGYDMRGGQELMEALHERIFEDQQFGYWQTHPFFTDRIAQARRAVDAGGGTPSAAEVRDYRERVRARLAALAESVLDDPTAMFLYRAALRAGPEGGSSFEIEHQLLRMRAERLRAAKPVLRAYGPLLADYDSLIALARSVSDAPVLEAPAPDAPVQRAPLPLQVPEPPVVADPDRKGPVEGSEVRRASLEGPGGAGQPWDPQRARLLERMVADRDSLARERDASYEPIREIVQRENAGRAFLELFLTNFPDDPMAPRLRLRLAELYRLAFREDDAALVLAGLPAGTVGAPTRADPAWREEAQDALRRLLPDVKEMTTTQKILHSALSDSVRFWATERLAVQASGLDSLEVASHFLETYPEAEIAPVVQAKLEVLAMEHYYAARLNESMREFQTALDLYNELTLLAPRSQGANLAREGVRRIQAMAAAR